MTKWTSLVLFGVPQFQMNYYTLKWSFQGAPFVLRYKCEHYTLYFVEVLQESRGVINIIHKGMYY